MRSILFVTTMMICFSVSAMTIQSIIDEKGQPNMLIDSSDGNKLYIYIKQTKQIIPSYSTSVIAAPDGQAIGFNVPTITRSTYTSSCTTTYKVDKNGTIVNFQSSGNC